MTLNIDLKIITERNPEKIYEMEKNKQHPIFQIIEKMIFHDPRRRPCIKEILSMFDKI